MNVLYIFYIIFVVRLGGVIAQKMSAYFLTTFRITNITRNDIETTLSKFSYGIKTWGTCKNVKMSGG
jgi:hypothetical protein